MVNRTDAGQLGTRTNAQVEYQIEGNGQTIKPVADSTGRTISRIVGEDSNGDPQRIQTDTTGNLKTKLFGERVGTGTLTAIKVDGDGSIKVAEFENYTDIYASDGWITPATGSWTAFTGPQVEDGTAISVTASSGNSDEVFIRTQTGNKYPLSPGEEQNWGIKNTSNIEAQAQTSGDQVKWTTEAN